MTTCKQWTIPVSQFSPLCTNEFRPVIGTDGCPICVAPQVVQGVCSACTSLIIPRTYRVTLSIDGNGVAGGTPDYGCGTDYNREFLLYWVSGCLWESSEKEIYSSCPGASSATDAVVCTDISAYSPRARVSLTVSTRTTSTSLDTVFTVAANWRSHAVSGYNQTVRSRGYTTDCDKSASCLFYDRSLSFNSAASAGVWANPFVGEIGGGRQLTMTATVAPL